MNTLIIYASIHHKNTEKIAKEIGNVLSAKVVSFSDVKKEELEEIELVGFGSGVYLSKFHKGLINLVENLPKVDKKKAFIFSTSGMKKNIILNRSHAHMEKILEKKGFELMGDFNCLGYDTYGPIKYIGGVNKGRPSKKDIEAAKSFAEKLIENV